MIIHPDAAKDVRHTIISMSDEEFHQFLENTITANGAIAIRFSKEVDEETLFCSYTLFLKKTRDD